MKIKQRNPYVKPESNFWEGFWKSIFDMEWKEWKIYIIYCFLAAVVGSLMGVYIDSWLKWVELF